MRTTLAGLFALLPLMAFAEPAPTPAPQFQGSQRFSECSSFISTCQPTLSYCASAACQYCTSIGQSVIDACCAMEPAPTECFFVGGPTAASVSATTTASTTTYASFTTRTATPTTWTTTLNGAVLPTQAVGAGILAGVAVIGLL